MCQRRSPWTKGNIAYARYTRALNPEDRSTTEDIYLLAQSYRLLSRGLSSPRMATTVIESLLTECNLDGLYKLDL